MKYNRTGLAGDIGFSTIIDGKFKTCSLIVRFITELSRSTAAANALGIGALSTSNSSLRTLAELNEQLSALYGSGLSSSAVKRGDVQVLTLSASWICDKYAIDGEDISGGMLNIVRDCLFAPNVTDGAFDSESFMITKKDLLDRIDAELNSKRTYALSRAGEFAFRGEPAENSCYGTKESAEAVTAAGAYEAYKALMSSAQIEISYVAPEEDVRVQKLIEDGFAAVGRSVKPVTFTGRSPVRSEPETFSDEFDVRQCKMVLTFKSASEDVMALKMLNTLFGATPVSKLFMNVREKLSLCYYCASRLITPKGALMVDSGVERSSIGKAKDEILRQLDEIRKGNITDEEMSSALLTLDNALTQVGDTPSSYSSWYFERFCDGRQLTPEEEFREYQGVTKARIVQAANSLALDSIYIMYDKEDKE
ncbi:MAG: insulinase family protein [Ruminococcus sp.]|nr:insulinase family protein [Ruminococcus sp.]